MKRGCIKPVGRIHTDIIKDGQSIEEQMRIALKSGEPIQATAKIEYSERGEGVLPQFDIRTDRFEIAQMATDRVHASQYAQRMRADGFELKDGQWIKLQNETGGEA